jgi:hypothetical protein
MTLQTMECPWIPDAAGACGRPGASCIQPGAYTLIPRATEARGGHWILKGPPLGVYCYPQDIPAGCYGRSLVLVHAANWAHELMGCIAPGLGRARDNNGEWMVTSSQAAMAQLRGALSGIESAELMIS